MWPERGETWRSEVELRKHEWAKPASGARICVDHAFLDLCLTPRPSPARGRYVDRWPPGRAEPVGSILFIPPGMTFDGSWGAGKQRSLSCFIDSRYFSDGLNDLTDHALVECLDVKNADVLYGMRRLAREMANPTPVSPILREALLITLSVDLVRHLASRAAAGRTVTAIAPWRMKLIEDRIRSPEPLPKVAELAALCRMSTRHLARAFRHETGGTLRERIKAAGLARAQQILTEGRAPIKQIASQIGFASTSSFSSAFTRATGTRPKDLRAQSDWLAGLSDGPERQPTGE